MNTLLGLLIIAVGSFCQSSSYVPIKKVKEWSWESFWLVQGIFAWLVFPLLGALLAVPAGSSLGEILSTDPSAAFKAAGYGVLWGVGGLTFGLSMRYLGVALGQSIALGTCAGFGTLFPAIFAGENLFAGKGLVLLLGVSITLAGIAVIGYAGSLRSQNMTDEEKRAAVKDFALTKGLAVALLAGVMSACFNLGLEAGRPLQVEGGSALFRTLPATLMVTLGGFVTNAAYCLWQNARNPHVRRLRQGDALCQQPVVLRVGRGAVVLAVLRLRHRADLLRARVGRGGIRLVHPHGAQRHLLERVGHYPPGVARGVAKDRGRIGLRPGDPDFLTRIS